MKGKSIYQQRISFTEDLIGKYNNLLTILNSFSNFPLHRTPTPIKEVINYEYAIESEKKIRHSYDKFLDEVKFK